MAATIKGINVVIGTETTGLQKALSDVNKKSRDIQSELKKVEKLLKLDPKNTELVAQKQQLLKEAVANTKEKLDRLKEAQEQVNEQFKKGEISEEQYRAFQREIAQTEQDLKKFEGRLKNTGQTAGQLGKKLQDAGKKMTDVGKNLSMKLTAPIVGAGVAAIKMASDFEDALAQASTLVDETQVSLADIKGGILDISTATGIAATEIAGSVYDALSSGVETADVLKYVEANVLLAKAGFTEMGVAVDATSTILNAYGDAAFDVVKIGNILVKTQDEGKITVDELGKVIGRVIPTASALGVNMDQLGASYAIMTAKGQNANIATTNLNSLLVELGKTGSKSDEALREMTEKSFRELIDEGKSVGDVLGLLKEKADKSGLSLSDMFGSVTAGSAALTLVSGGVDGFNAEVDIMNDSAGTMQKNFDKLQTPSEKMAIALNKLKNVGIELGAQFLPIIAEIAEKVGGFIDKFGNLSPGAQKVIIIVALLVAAIGPLLVAIGALAPGLGSLIALFGGLAAGPVVAVIAAIVALGVGLAALWKNNEQFRKGAAETFNKIKAVAVPIIEMLKDSLHSAAESLRPVWESLVQVFSDLEPVLKTLGAVIGTVLVVGFGIVTGVINGVIKAIAPLMKAFTGLLQIVVNVVGFIVSLINGDFVGAFEHLKRAGEGVIEFFSGMVGTIVGFVGGLVEGVVSFFKELYDMLVGHSIIPDLVGAVIEWFASLPGELFTIIKDMMEKIISGIEDKISSIFDVVTKVKDAIVNPVNNAMSSIKNLISSAVSWIVTKFNNFHSTVTGIFSRVKTAITSPIDTAITTIKGWLSNLRLPEIKLPKIKLPHFKIAGDFSIVPPKVPSFSVDWYDRGGIFRNPAIIGVGEKRPEVVGALDDIRYLIREELQGLQAAAGGSTVNLHVGTLVADELGLKKLEQTLRKYRVAEDQRRGGK